MLGGSVAKSGDPEGVLQNGKREAPCAESPAPPEPQQTDEGQRADYVIQAFRVPVLGDSGGTDPAESEA
ncbi:MAG: hypothetical protein AMXMBFR33_34910 [Candidatus Xenobia bacterium]